MKRTQTLKANHLSKNSVIIADDTDIVFPNVDKNSKIVKINLIHSFIHSWVYFDTLSRLKGVLIQRTK